MTITGREGTLRWVYLPALTFGVCQYSGTRDGGTLSAQIVSSDQFRLSKRPLIAVVSIGRAEWRWSVDDLQISGDRFTATVSRL